MGRRLRRPVYTVGASIARPPKEGKIMDFKNKIILAPMAGVTDYAFRKIARKYGADFCISEMVSAKAMEFNDKKTGTLAEIREDDTPIGIQIFGHEPKCMASAAYQLSRGLYEHTKSKIFPSTIDINMGCPVKKIVSSGDGSALMRDISLSSEIIKACVEASSVPVTVKFRAGWDKESINCVEFAKMAEGSGASAIAIHGRTRAQMYEPNANWDYIKMVKEAVKIPVIGMGGVSTADNVIEMMLAGATAVGVGAANLVNPFACKQIIEDLPKVMEKYKIKTLSEIIGGCE